VVTRVLWLQQGIKEAIDAPRVHHQLLPDAIVYERDYFPQVHPFLLWCVVYQPRSPWRGKE
jgi:gamma-glutamyltranspeptidase